MIAVHPSVPAKTLPELVALSKTKQVSAVVFGQRRIAAPGHRAAEERLQGRFPARAVQGRRPGGDRHHRRPRERRRDGHLRRSTAQVKDGKLRALAVTNASALGRAARRAHHRRAGPRGHAGGELVRPDGAEGHAGRHRREAERRAGEGAASSPAVKAEFAKIGIEGFLQPSSEAYPQVPRRGDRALGQDRPRRRREGRLRKEAMTNLVARDRCLLIAAVCTIAAPQGFPNKPVKLVDARSRPAAAPTSSRGRWRRSSRRSGASRW